MANTAAIIGGGVVGGGWAARFLLMGWDVRVLDPDPESERKLGEVLDGARRAMPGLYDVALPAEGRLSFHGTMSEAVAGAAWVQESVPERLDLKGKIFRSVQEHCDPAAVIGSSTSGFKPSDLQGSAARPGQIVVAHPFVPVYLLPLVELVASEANPPEAVARAEAVLSEIGMFPLKVRAEIDAHIADRFLEAVWREALWLVKDGVATTAEIDEAIRMGFGLRWAQIGLFEGYRIAGGEAGMRHFLAQFGPALKWPWTRLTEVPDFDDALVELIASQSDEQSGARSVRELERRRDTNLVAILRALKWQNWGAGAHLIEQDRRIAKINGMARRFDEIEDLEKPILTFDRAIPLDWTDYNGHMNEAKYLQAFGDATDRFMEIVGCDAEYIATGGSYFTAETHIRHLAEIHAGRRVRIETLCLDGVGKRMHLFHSMWEGGTLCATGEHMLIHVSLATRRAAPPSESIARQIGAIAAAHAGLDRPKGIGRHIGQGR